MFASLFSLSAVIYTFVRVTVYPFPDMQAYADLRIDTHAYGPDTERYGQMERTQKQKRQDDG